MSRIILMVVIQLICVWCHETKVCQLQDGTVGKCIPFLECATALKNYSALNIMSMMCPMENNVYTVCCPQMKRVEKCKFYAEYRFKNITIPGFGGRLSRVIKKNKCGRTGAPFISGGTAALAREYPHSALLGFRPIDKILWRCGGSLVSSRYVLTAGHCLYHSVLGFVVKVRLGELNYNSTEDDAQPEDYDVDERIPHPDYKRASKYNDIALLKLSSQVILSPYIRPICIPTADYEPEEYIATGWGYTTDFGDASDTLLKVKLHSYHFNDCQNTYRSYQTRKFRYGLRPSQLCAGHRTERKDTCSGDSGGPLQVYHPDVTCSYTQYGITSFGISCQQIDFPAIYTRVFYYVDWIESIIWATDEDV